MPQSARRRAAFLMRRGPPRPSVPIRRRPMHRSRRCPGHPHSVLGAGGGDGQWAKTLEPGILDGRSADFWQLRQRVVDRVPVGEAKEAFRRGSRPMEASDQLRRGRLLMYGGLVAERSATWLNGPEPLVRTELGTIIARSLRMRLITARSIDGGRALHRAAGGKVAVLRIAARQSRWLRRHRPLPRVVRRAFL